MMNYFLTILCWGMIAFASQAQEKIPIQDADYVNSSVEMADSFRADGKIYVVVAVVLILLMGLLVYLINMDRSIKKLEKEMDGHSV